MVWCSGDAVATTVGSGDGIVSSVRWLGCVCWLYVRLWWECECVCIYFSLSLCVCLFEYLCASNVCMRVTGWGGGLYDAGSLVRKRLLVQTLPMPQLSSKEKGIVKGVRCFSNWLNWMHECVRGMVSVLCVGFVFRIARRYHGEWHLTPVSDARMQMLLLPMETRMCCKIQDTRRCERLDCWNCVKIGGYQSD